VRVRRGGPLADQGSETRAGRCVRDRLALIKLNHTIVHSIDPRASAEFFTAVFGLPAPTPFGPFLDVDVANEVTLAFLSADGMDVQAQHYAFLVSDKEFDAIFGRVKARSLDYWADPALRLQGKINTHFGGRGVYFKDPSGHLLEIITKPYGSWDEL
jgi:catechol 2,3-dioxygenase-like lactoylglutathione lyase family enzyme